MGLMSMDTFFEIYGTFATVVLIILGIISIAYDFILIIINPGTFLDIVFSFTHIWLTLGAYLIFVAVYRIKTKHSFWSCWKHWIKITFVSLASVVAVISIINLKSIKGRSIICRSSYNFNI